MPYFLHVTKLMVTFQGEFGLTLGLPLSEHQCSFLRGIQQLICSLKKKSMGLTLFVLFSYCPIHH